MIIKRLRGHNFKSYADLDITFDPTTSFIGISDHGKTTLLKATHLVCMHGNWPEDWIRKGTDAAWLEIELTNGNKVRRDRKRGSQSTTVTIGGVCKTLEGVKTAEPYVRKAMGFNAITLDESTGPEDLNFIGVNDSSYGMNNSPEVMLRKISGILGTNVIEDARNRLTKEKNKLSPKRESILEELGPLRTRVTSRKSMLDTMEKSLQKLNELNTDWNDKKQRLEKFKKIRDQFESPLYTIHQVDELLVLASKISKNLFTIKNNLKTKELLEGLKSTQITINVDWNLIDEIRLDLQKLKEYSELHTRLNKLNTEIANLKLESNSAIIVTQELIAQLKKEKVDLLNKLGLCPVCGQVIK